MRALAVTLVLLGTSPAAADGPAPKSPRPELESLAERLDEAVNLVSHASVSLLGVDVSKGYYQTGVGAFFVVPPRAIPLPRRTGSLPESEAHARQASEQGHHEFRLEITRVARAQRPEESLDRERQIRIVEQQADAFQREAERVRQLAERELDDVTREVRDRLEGRQVVPEAQPEVRPTPAPGRRVLPAPGPPPWRFWFHDRSPAEEKRSEERVVSDVRQALLKTLGTHGMSLHSVAPDERVVVAVDFLPQAGFLRWRRAKRTLVLRVPKALVVERAAGQVTAREFAQRAQATEY